MRNRLQAAGARIASAALVWAAGSLAAGEASRASAQTPERESAARAPAPADSTVRVLDVPYVPQSERLCGGAALAMILRYWGEPNVRAEDFASLAPAGERGITGDSLVSAARARGWLAFPMQAKASDVRDHLDRGRPVIALVDVGAPIRHYVVLLASTPRGVLLHDPAVAPFRAETQEEFDRAWSAAGRWALLVLPAPGRRGLADPSKVALEEPFRTGATPGAGAPPPPPPDTTGFETPVIPEIAATGASISGCDGMVSAGVRRARSGANAEAAGLLSAAAALCPRSAAPIRELAGLRFQEKSYRAAADLAGRALALEPNDAYTWRLLAGSRYMAGDVREALEAWNRVREPRTDLIQVDGLRRTRHEAVEDQVDLPSGALLTWEEYRRAQRRLDEIPAASRARMEVRPSAGGAAQVRIAVTERPLLFDGVVDAGMAAGQAVAQSEAKLRISSPLRLGEVWTLAYRFRENRPRARLLLDAPALLARPGLWHLEGMWERQAYAADGSITGPLVREERRRGAASYADWIGPDWRVEIGGGLDRFGPADPPPGFDAARLYGTAGAAVEARTVRDHISIALSGDGWARAGDRPFQKGDVLVRYGSGDYASGDWLARAGFSAASESAPLALWTGAGTGTGRGPLLRAHPLLEDGIVNGIAFGRRLAHGGIERRIFPWELNSAPVLIGFALFVDAAKAWDPLVAREVPWQVDVGAGLRIASLGRHGELRADFAYGLEDEETAISLGLQAR